MGTMASSKSSVLLCGLILLFWSSLLATTEASRILFALSFSAKSHNIVITALSKELATRGHTVKVITPFPSKDLAANYTEIDTSETVIGKFKSPKITDQHGVIEVCLLVARMSEDICRGVMQMPEVQNLIKSAKSGERYELVFVSMFYSECAYAFAEVFDAPLALISPAGSFPVTDSLVGNPALTSFVPNVFSPFSDRMTFAQRTLNSLMQLGTLAVHYTLIYPKHNAVLRDVFGDDFPSVQQIEKRVSLILLNSHHSLLFPRPMVPNLVEVGGMHVKPPKPLPQDLKKFLDEAKEGVVYFSLGSNLKSADLPDDIRDAFLAAFCQLKQKVLWKWEADILPGQPANVRLSKWWPQADILAHPNTKLFITHGGLLSFQETVDRGVPLIGIPFYGDQEMNMNRVTALGVGLQMDFSTITKEVVLEKINTILKDPSYSRKMKDLSAIWKDRQESALDTAVYWTEYILRHKGAPHLKSGALDLAWCQYYLVDVVTVLAAVVLATLGLVVLSLRLLLRTCRRKGGRKPKSSSKEKKN